MADIKNMYVHMNIHIISTYICVYIIFVFAQSCFLLASQSLGLTLPRLKTYNLI